MNPPASIEIASAEAACDVEAEPSIPHLFRLHPELLVDMLQYLSPVEVCRIAETCRPLRSLCHVADGILWKSYCLALWRDKQGFRRFVEHADVLSACHRVHAPSHILVANGQHQGPLFHTAHKSRNTAPNRGGQHIAPIPFSPDTTLRCIQASILPPSAALKRAPPSMCLPPAAVSSEDVPHPHRRRYWWELSSVEQTRRLRRMLSQSSDSTDSSLTSGSDDEPHAEADNAAATGHDESGHLDGLHTLEQKILHDVDEAWRSDITWKFAYFMSIRSSKRTTLSSDDLKTMTWSVSFRQIPGRRFPAQFDNDRALLLTPIAPEGFAFQLSQQGSELNVHVFPKLVVQRKPFEHIMNTDMAATNGAMDLLTSSQTPSCLGWGWCISNFFVDIVSDEVPPPSYLQYLRLNSSIRPP